MAAREIYELTHPEILSETRLKEILESRCIDFSSHRSVGKSELIELYKRVALPLPRRDAKNNTTNSSLEETVSFFESCEAFEETSNDSSAASCAESTKRSRRGEALESIKEQKITTAQTVKKLRLNEWKKISNGCFSAIDKRDEAPLKKRQKITWP